MPTDFNAAFETLRVNPDREFRWEDHPPDWTWDPSLSRESLRGEAERMLAEDIEKLSTLQERLYASDSWSVLVIFQAMDAGGKDSTIKNVMSGLNPQGCEVTSFKHPSAEELEHNFLWRYARRVPERGRIGIFNRSHYEEVLVVRVHPELVVAQRIPGLDPGDGKTWKRRFHDIREFEKHLARNGTAIIKFMLNISREEQRKRLLARIEKPEKHWKFDPGDLRERSYWDDYMKAYAEMLSRTSTRRAPWYVIPADSKRICRAIVARLLVQTLESLDIRYPEVTAEKSKAIEEARRELERQG